MSEKENQFDTLGARMKAYETSQNGEFLDVSLPIYGRIDGRRFSKFTKGLGYPYFFSEELCNKESFEFAKLMEEVCCDLAEEFKFDLIETHSDEISFCWKKGVNAPFDGRYFKLITNIASFTAASFVRNAFTIVPPIGAFDSEEHYSFPEIVKRINDGKQIPSFDCRIYNVPDEVELMNCFLWRQNDCVRGSINQLAQQYFSPKQLSGKSCEDRKKMIVEKGPSWEDQDPTIKYGLFIKRCTFEFPISKELKKYVINIGKETIIRHYYNHLVEVERLTEMTCDERVNLLFH